MAGINANTRIEFDVVGSTSGWIPRDENDIRSSAIASLSYYGTVNSLTITKTSGSIFSQSPLTFGYRANGAITTKYSHASINDIRSIVAGAFWSAAGEQATVSFPGYGEIQGTGTGDERPDATNKFLTAGAITIIASVGVAVFVLKRG